MPKVYQFPFVVRPAMRLREIEAALKATRVIVPVPSRPTLIKLIEEGTLQGFKLPQANSCSQSWHVYEDSFHAWVRSFQPEAYEPVAPSPAHNPHAARPLRRVA
ncbi:MAG: hypothetical protein ABW208_10235 [Pyrinomonadaceae bacterium]